MGRRGGPDPSLFPFPLVLIVLPGHFLISRPYTSRSRTHTILVNTPTNPDSSVDPLCIAPLASRVQEFVFRFSLSSFPFSIVVVVSIYLVVC